jgi:hypothetical protein
MSNQGTKVVVDEAKRDLAGAYLWMSKALEVHDPNRDLWSEPTDFGDAAARRKRADETVERVRSLGPEFRSLIEPDQSRFREALAALNGGEPFGPEHRELLRDLRSAGMDWFNRSVSRAEQAGSSG